MMLIVLLVLHHLGPQHRLHLGHLQCQVGYHLDPPHRHHQLLIASLQHDVIKRVHRGVGQQLAIELHARDVVARLLMVVIGDVRFRFSHERRLGRDDDEQLGVLQLQLEASMVSFSFMQVPLRSNAQLAF